MDVPVMTVVNAGLAAVLVGAGLLLVVAFWWAWAGDGVSLPRERWPRVVRVLAMLGWGLWVGGLLLQVLGHFGSVGVATWR